MALSSLYCSRSTAESTIHISVNPFFLYTHIFEGLTNNLREELGKNAYTRNMGNNEWDQDADNAYYWKVYFALIAKND